MYPRYNNAQPWMAQLTIPNSGPTTSFYSMNQPTTQLAIPKSDPTTPFYSMNQPTAQPAIPNSDPTAPFYSIDQPTTQPTIPHDNHTSYFDPAAAMLELQELKEALAKEKGTVKVTRATFRKVTKTNKDLHATNIIQLETNRRQDKQLQQYHRMISCQVPNYWKGYQMGYQHGLAECEKEDTSKKNIKIRPISQLINIAQQKQAQNSQQVSQQRELYLKQLNLKLAKLATPFSLQTKPDSTG